MSAFRLFLAALMATAALVGCSKKEEGVAPRREGPAMWTISDADSTIHLFGTFHLLPDGVDWQDRSMTEAFDNSSLLILEADVAGAAPSDIVTLVQQYGVAPPGESLRGKLSPEDRAAYEALTTSLALDPASLDAFQPWYAATVLTVKYAEQQGLTAAEGVEKKLAEEAELEAKPTAYLETVQEQILFFANLPPEIQVEMLTSTVEELQDAGTLIGEMQSAWLKGDTAAMAAVFDKSVREVPELYEVLIADRNRRWADEIETLLAGSGTAFIAVGAGHLVGGDSVVAILKERGIAVEGP